MDFGAFDDELFNGDKDEISKTGASVGSGIYVPKFEHPCWFVFDFPGKDDVLDKDRMRANYYYWKGDYEKAVHLYDRLLKSTSSCLLKLEFTESYARTLIACKRFDEAEGVSIGFYKGAINYDQQLQALNLLSDLYWHQSGYKRCAIVTGCLATLMEGGNGDLWYRLGHCFYRWTDSADGTDDEHAFINLTHLLSLDLEFPQSYLDFCRKSFSRAYALYSSTYASSVGYARERNEKMRSQIEVELRSVPGSLHEVFGGGGNRKLTAGEEDTGQGDGSGDKHSDAKRDLDKMLDEDLVNVFEVFVKKWLL